MTLIYKHQPWQNLLVEKLVVLIIKQVVDSEEQILSGLNNTYFIFCETPKNIFQET